MRQKSTNKFAPKSLQEFVFAGDETAQLINRFADDGLIEDVILHGPAGTGKSTLAELLPGLIEPGFSKNDFNWIDCHQHRSIDDIQRKIREPAMLWPSGARHYFILEEADGLSRDAMKSLKTVMDKVSANSLFIFTTNYIDKIDDPLRSRCREIYIGYASPERWLMRVADIVSAETGKTIPDDQLLDVIRMGGGDGRQIIRYTQELVLRINGAQAKKSKLSSAS